MRRLAELKFDVEIKKYKIKNLNEGHERLVHLASANHLMPFKEVKSLLYNVSEEFERNQWNRDSEISTRHGLKRNFKGKRFLSCYFREEIEGWDSGYVTKIKVFKPDNMSLTSFVLLSNTLIKDTLLND